MEDIPKTGKETEVEKEQTTLRLPADLKEQLAREAKERGMGFNALVLLIIREYLRN